jgi:hypothetical protein
LTDTPIVALDAVQKVLREQLQFQRRWQLFSMTFYVTSTVGTLLFTSAAGVLAAMHYDTIAAILAAAATVLVGVEKSLLFREKWKFHLTTRTSLELLQTEIVTKGMDAASIGARLGVILESYASSLPVEARGT